MPSPGGADLVHDEAFEALLDAARGRPDQQFGKTVREAVEPNWAELRRMAVELLAQQGPARPGACNCWWACTRRHGLGGLAGGLQLIDGLLERAGGTRCTAPSMPRTMATRRCG